MVNRGHAGSARASLTLSQGETTVSGRALRRTFGGRGRSRCNAVFLPQDEVERSHLDAIAAALLGVIERLVGLREELRHIERRLFAMHQADADGGADRAALDFKCGLREALADPLGHGERLV